MKTKPFNLEEYLANPSQKVVTREGREVRIVCTDKLGDSPIIACIKYDEQYEDYNAYHENGAISAKKESDQDLFFLDKSEELTEFEKHVQAVMMNCGLIGCHKTYKDIDSVKATSKSLLDLARNELESEAQEKLQILLSEAREHGRQEALKDIPKWKKFGAGIAGNYDRRTN